MDIETGFADLLFDSLGESRSRIKTQPRRNGVDGDWYEHRLRA